MLQPEYCNRDLHLRRRRTFVQCRFAFSPSDHNQRKRSALSFYFQLFCRVQALGSYFAANLRQYRCASKLWPDVVLRPTVRGKSPVSSAKCPEIHGRLFQVSSANQSVADAVTTKGPIRTASR